MKATYVYLFLLYLSLLSHAQLSIHSWEDPLDDNSHVASLTNVEIFGGNAHLLPVTSTQFSGGSGITVETDPTTWNYTVKIKIPKNSLFTKFKFNLTGKAVETSERKPLDAVLVTDVSGSMSGKVDTDSTITKMRAAKEADKIFVNTLLPDNTGNTRIGLVNYSGDAYRDTCLIDDNATLVSDISSYSAGGDTCIACGMKVAISLLDTSSKQNRVILLMTDGRANIKNGTNTTGTCDGKTVLDKVASGGYGVTAAENLARATAREAGNKGITVYTIGFGTNAKHDVLQDMADYGNGEYYFAPSNEELKEIYKKIAIKVSRYYPKGITIDVGGTGNPSTQWNHTDELQSEIVDLITKLNNLMTLYPNCNCPRCMVSGDECVIDIAVKSDTGGTLTFSDLELTGRATSGDLLSVGVNPSDPFGGWYKVCYDAGNLSTGKTLMIYLVDDSGNVLTCPNCTLIGENGTHCYDIGDIDSAIRPIHLKTEFTTDEPAVSPELRYWNLSWIASIPPNASADGPYTCTTGEPVTLNGNYTTDNVYCQSGGDNCVDLAYYWEITGINSMWSDSLKGVKPTLTCPPVGTYNVSLKVTNKDILTDIDTTYLYSNPTEANLTIEDVYISEPSISGIESEVLVTVKNIGMSKSTNYNVSLQVLNENGNVVYSKNITQSSLPGEKKRKSGLGWIPDKPGEYTIQVTVVNETGDPVYTTGKTIYIQKQESTNLVAPEYPGVSMFIVLLLVALLGYLISSRERHHKL